MNGVMQAQFYIHTTHEHGSTQFIWSPDITPHIVQGTSHITRMESKQA